MNKNLTFWYVWGLKNISSTPKYIGLRHFLLVHRDFDQFLGNSNYSTGCFIPQRLILAIMGFSALVNAYTMRMVLNIAIVRIVVKRNDSGAIDEGYCPFDNITKGTEIAGGDKDWSEQLQGFILSAFYIGYVLTHIPGGILAQKYGGKWCLGLGILSTAIFTLVTPLVIENFGPYGLIALRILVGFCEGTTFPALSALLACWAPRSERSKLGSFVFGGAQIGNILGTAISGVLLSQFRWPSVFYFFGGDAIIWFLVFICICFSDPESHPFISKEEKEYLQKEIGSLERDKSLPPTPWLAIATNAPMIAMVIAQLGHDWGYFVMATDLPKYMNDVLHFPIKKNGFYSALPYAVMWVVSIVAGIIADFIIDRKYMTITNQRKLFTTIASVGPSVLTVIASYSGCNKTLAVLFFTLGMATMGPYYSGMKLNSLDLSPNYAGTLMAITNGIAACSGIMTPIFIGLMTPNRSLYEWRNVFWVGFAVFSATNVVYLIWASGEVQPFNEPKKLNKTEGGTSKNIPSEQMGPN